MASGAGGAWQVPKEELTSILQVLLQARRLKISSRLEHARTLQTELQNYRVKITAAPDAADASWREHEHDDLVLATALACWLGERFGCLANSISMFNVAPREWGLRMDGRSHEGPRCFFG